MNMDLKRVIAHLIKRANIREESASTSAATSIAAGSTAWITVPAPSSGTPIAVVGYYLRGGASCSVYNLRLSSNGEASIALRNYGSSSQSVTVTADYLVVD